jgi:glycosyltransferase involved in cell wall biosynthesis
MRVLFALNHYFHDPRPGAFRSLRTIVRWLAAAGHECRVLTTARVETPLVPPVETHLARLGVAPRWVRPARSRDVAAEPRRTSVRYSSGGAAVTMLMTEHNDEAHPNRAEAAQYQDMLEQLLASYKPDLLVACNSHPMIRSALATARRRGVATAFTVRSYGYDDRRFFEHVDHVFTCSSFLSDFYHDRIGLLSTPLEPPIDWSDVEAPAESRAFVTFVNPLPAKGLTLFARLADMLGAERPDIPVLVVESTEHPGLLNTIAEFDFTRYPQIMAAPPVEQPREYFALTRLLLVPSVWDEPFGRVAAEAMINGIPAVVSDRGYLPRVIGGDASHGGAGRVVPIPAWMNSKDPTIPSANDVRPWFEAVCALWDDAEWYQELSRRARSLAQTRYSEAASRQGHLEYLTGLRPAGSVFCG